MRYFKKTNGLILTSFLLILFISMISFLSLSKIFFPHKEIASKRLQYQFLYQLSDKELECEYMLRSTFFPNEHKGPPSPPTDLRSNRECPTLPLFIYDPARHQSEEVTFAAAKRLKLSSKPLSPDGFLIAFQCNTPAIKKTYPVCIVGSGNHELGIDINNKKLTFIGWIL